jgi:hypothetical protein
MRTYAWKTEPDRNLHHVNNAAWEWDIRFAGNGKVARRRDPARFKESRRGRCQGPSGRGHLEMFGTPVVDNRGVIARGPQSDSRKPPPLA